jgi:integrase
LITIGVGAVVPVGYVALIIGFGLALTTRVTNQWQRAIVLRLGKFSGVRGSGVFFIAQRAKGLDERQKLQAQTAIALTFFAGLRPGEARRGRWEDYDCKTFSVKRSVWRKHTTDPKTASAAKPVLVIEPLRELLAELREAEGNPAGQHYATERTTATVTRKIGSRLSGKASIRSVEASQRS